MPIGAFKLNSISLYQAPGGSSEPYWITSFTPASGSLAYGVDVDSSGNCYISGETAVTGGNGAFIIKLPKDSSSITWQRYSKASSTGTCRGYAVVVDPSGNSYTTVRTLNSGGGYTLGLLSKWDSSGTHQTTVQYVNNFTQTSCRFLDIVINSGGTSLYTTGSVYTTGTTTNSLFLGKWSTSFTLTWGRRITTTNATLMRVALDSSENSIVVGSCQTSGQTAGSTDIFITKYNSSGTQQWQKTIGSATAQQGSGVGIHSSTGDAFICGTHNNGTKALLYIARVVAAGTSISWQKTLECPTDFITGESGLPGLAVDSSDNVYVHGSAQDGSGFGYGIIAKYNASGTLQWKKELRYTGSTAISFTDMKLSPDGLSIVLTGYTNNVGPMVAKLPIDGTLTGTYGNWVYSDSTLTEATPALSITNRTASSGTQTLTADSQTLSNGNTSFTKTTTSVA